MDLFFDAIEARHVAAAVPEAMPVRLREVIHFVFAGIEAARRNRVQQRLPEMGTRAVDQRNRRQRATAKTIAEPGGELEGRGASTYHHDPVHCLRGREPIRPRRCCRGGDRDRSVEYLCHSCSLPVGWSGAIRNAGEIVVIRRVVGEQVTLTLPTPAHWLAPS
jgi:hypothetical protein